MNNPREKLGWYFYDWANSAFSTTVVTVFLGPYLTSIATAAATKGFVYPLGIPVAAGSFFPYVVSLSVGLQVIFLPILGAIADYSNIKKQLMMLFAYIGAFATMCMYFLQGENYLLGGGLFLLANLSFGAAIVFYNAFLPEISTADERDTVSSRGFAMGYIGGGILLALNLVLVSGAEGFGLTTGQAVRISLLSAGVWWALFTLVPISLLKSREPAKALPPGEKFLTVGFKQLRHTFSQLPKYPQTLLFLIGYLLYNDGIQTVIALSAQFGQEEIGLSITTLTQVILMVQFIAFFGANLFAYIARWIGTKRAIMLSLLVWIGILIYAYGFLQKGDTTGFFIMGAFIAVVLGGSQALSRSVFSLMIPEGQEAEYFSLYEVSERGTSWLGPLLFGLALQRTSDYRISILALVVFFIAGLAILTQVDIRRAALEAGNEAPAHV
ncbi:MAG: MFS transporter [Ardenticatenales bacterium]|nr:MFS transporter [Ardenticatenales bacterium]